MKKLALFLGLVLTLAVAAAPASAAGFYGSTVSADYNWPTIGSILYASGTAVAGPGVEFDDIGGFGVGNSPSVDFSDTNILVDYAGGWSLSGTGSFDGWVFTDSVGNINGVSLAGTDIAGFTAADLSFDAHHIYANTLGLGSWGAGSFISIDATFSPVPEPSSATLLIAVGILFALASRWLPARDQA